MSKFIPKQPGSDSCLVILFAYAGTAGFLAFSLYLLNDMGII